jgi:hypothetical protein
MSSANFVSTIRTNGTPLRVVPDGYAGPIWTVRVQLLEAWDAVRVEVAPSATVDALVSAALTQLGGAGAQPDAYDCKLRGVRIARRDQAVATAGVVDGSTLLLALAARLPVR